jgi:hypothetical protein
VLLGLLFALLTVVFLGMGIDAGLREVVGGTPWSRIGFGLGETPPSAASRL